MSNTISKLPSTTPMTISISDAVAMVGISRAQIYRLVGKRQINMVKSGRRSLIVVSSLIAYVQNLPDAVIRPPS
jgi:predicted DNA-binding transcriptional regulator AlpA